MRITRLLALSILFFLLPAFSGVDSVKKSNITDSKILHEGNTKVLVFEIMKEISKPAWRTTQQAFEKAGQIGASYIILHLNTYGGMVNIADSIRTKIINSPIPVLVFIDNQAISAGALISIACDSIYMRPGASIGASTVVNQSGEVVPDKYQSFMRSTMRATAESHGKDTLIKGTDTTYVWHRDPRIAEAMVDPQLEMEGIIEKGQVLTMTTEEAIKVGYCEGKASSIAEVVKIAGLDDYELMYYEPEGIEVVIGFFLNPVVQGLLLLLIVGGLYFEFQTPGVGFPLAAAALGAILYFAPLYLEGLAENWELIAFMAGVILIAVEIFVIPGFGIAGVLGIFLMLTGLTLGLIDNVVFELEGIAAMQYVFQAFVRVIISLVIALGASLFVSRKIGTSNWFKGLALETVQDHREGYIGIDLHQKEMVGKTGSAYTVLRPSGKVMIDDELFDAMAEIGFIDKGTTIRVIRQESGQLHVVKA